MRDAGPATGEAPARRRRHQEPTPVHRQDFTGGPLFDDAARVHHGNALGHLRNDALIVGDEKQTESQFTSEAVQQIQDLFCTVTSSAVVGSSAIGSHGPAASAMAIMTRCPTPRQFSYTEFRR